MAELRNRLENATNSTVIQTLFKQISKLNVDQQQIKSPRANRILREKPVCFILEDLELANAEMVFNWIFGLSIHFIFSRSISFVTGLVVQAMVLFDAQWFALVLAFGKVPCWKSFAPAHWRFVYSIAARRDCREDLMRWGFYCFQNFRFLFL